MTAWTRRRRKPTRNVRVNAHSDPEKTGYKSWWRAIMPMVLLAVFICVGVWVWQKLSDPNTLAFKHIKVIVADKQINSKKLHDLVIHHIQGGFFSLRANDLRENLESIPWVERISIRRIWPNQLIITIHERHPYAKWGQNQLVTNKGKVYQAPPNVILNKLPILSGPDGTAEQMVIQHQKLSKDIKSLGLVIQKLTITPQSLWQVTLDNGIPVMLGHEDDLRRHWLLFTHLYPRLIAPKVKKVEYVDLRYSNGLVIKWK